MNIIVLSCVRSQAVGFVQSFRRMNVALTRAKNALYVCLSGKVFVSDANWSELIGNARKRGLLRTAPWNTSVQELKETITK